MYVLSNVAIILIVFILREIPCTKILIYCTIPSLFLIANNWKSPNLQRQEVSGLVKEGNITSGISTTVKNHDRCAQSAQP